MQQIMTGCIVLLNRSQLILKTESSVKLTKNSDAHNRVRLGETPKQTENALWCKYSVICVLM